MATTGIVEFPLDGRAVRRENACPFPAEAGLQGKSVQGFLSTARTHSLITAS